MKPAVWILGALLLATNGWWFYQAVDQGVTLMYRDQERYEDANRIVALTAVATEATRGLPKGEATALLQRLFPSTEAFEKDGAVNTAWISLPLATDGRVLGVALDEGTKQRAQPRGPARP